MKNSAVQSMNHCFSFLLLTVLIASCTSKPVETTHPSNEVNSSYTATAVENTQNYTTTPELSTNQNSTALEPTSSMVQSTYSVSETGIVSTDSSANVATFLGQVGKDGQSTIRPTQEGWARIIVRNRNDSRGRTDSVYELPISESFTLEAMGAFSFHKYQNQNMYLLDVTDCKISTLVCLAEQTPIAEPKVVTTLASTAMPTNPPATPAAPDAGPALTLIGIIIAIAACCL